MKKKVCVILSLILQHNLLFSQPASLNKQLFFLDDTPVEVTLTTDIRKLRNDKTALAYEPAKISMRFSDTSVISGDIRVKPRGNYRKNHCNLASLLLNFKSPSSSNLSPLNRLKLVGSCKNGPLYDELLLKEYMIYKIQNMLSNMSFRVRLLHITYNDSKDKVTPYTQYAFLIEDINDLAERNNCVEIKKMDLYTVQANREQMTFVNLFQYLIGNTDWSIFKCHNVKLLASKNDTLAKPYVIPYDFDFCGLVNAGYAEPAEELGIASVRERLYRGFPRTIDELITVIDIFQQKKESIMYYIDHFDLCSMKCRKVMESYLDDFYKAVANKKNIESLFISNARTE